MRCDAMQAQHQQGAASQANVNATTHAGADVRSSPPGRAPAGTDGSKIVLTRWSFSSCPGCSPSVGLTMSKYQPSSSQLSRPPSDNEGPFSECWRFLEILRSTCWELTGWSGLASSCPYGAAFISDSDYAAAAAADCRSSRRCEWRVVDPGIGLRCLRKGDLYVRVVRSQPLYFSFRAVGETLDGRLLTQ